MKHGAARTYTGGAVTSLPVLDVRMPLVLYRATLVFQSNKMKFTCCSFTGQSLEVCSIKSCLHSDGFASVAQTGLNTHNKTIVLMHFGEMFTVCVAVGKTSQCVDALPSYEYKQKTRKSGGWSRVFFTLDSSSTCSL